MTYTVANILHLVFSLLHTVFGIVVASLCIFGLITGSSLLLVFQQLVGQYCTILGVFGQACFHHKRGLKIANLWLLALNLVVLLQSLIFVGISYKSTLNSQQDMEDYKARNSTKVMHLYTKLSEYHGLVLGLISGIIVLCACTLFFGCRQRKMLDQQDKAVLEARSTAVQQETRDISNV